MKEQQELESVVIRFSGDSGDGMQLTGTQFSNTSAQMGNDLSTFPDYPSEIRAPAGTIAGVSGFQVHIGASEVITPGDEPDVLVAMNPAALKANLKWLKKGGAIIANVDAFDDKALAKAGYDKDPIADETALEGYKVIPAKITSQTMEVLKDLEIDTKSKARCKNFFALGMTYFIFGRDTKTSEDWINTKFAKKPLLAEANILALKAGWSYAETAEFMISTYKVPPAKIKPGKYRQLDGNTATALGLIRAAEASGLPLFQGSYPITPATDILHELSKHKNFRVKTFQAEDEIAGICTAIGASFGGALAVTTTSGPGVALKNEAMGLAIIYETPLVIVNVQRGGPSTGLPTKTEQSDLLQAMYGRNGEAPMIVVAACRPSDCFHMAYEASRLALKYMTPVMLLTDGYIANGAEPMRIPDLDKEYPALEHHMVKGSLKEGEEFFSYKRNKDLVRNWAVPGMAGYEHRIGGLEKQELTGNVSHDPDNHQKMCEIRRDKIKNAVKDIPLQTVEGDKTGDLLVLSWGGTYGAVNNAVRSVQKEGKRVSLCHMKYLNPMPSNLGEILSGFKKILIPELNLGQLRFMIDAQFKNTNTVGLNKVMGLPFRVVEIVDAINRELETL